MTTAIKKFRSIEGLSKIFTTLRANADYHNIPHSDLPTLNFTGTVKIHGTNAGIVIDSADATTVTAQGRDRVVTFDHDNAGFAAYCMSLTPKVIKEMYTALNPSGKGVLTVFGEWAGEGVQNNVAVGQMKKHFIIFSAHVDDKYVVVNKDYHNHEYRIYNVYEILTYNVDINFANPGDIEDVLTQLTLQVEAECPWAKQFGISGIGEGIVWHLTSNPTDSAYVFKTKGPKHSVRKSPTAKAATVNVEKVNSVHECVDIMLTEQRMEQMISDHKIDLIPENFGLFLKYVSLDCMKEESELLVANDLIWKDVTKTIAVRCRDWYFKKFLI
jgi:hypothetical protein